MRIVTSLEVIVAILVGVVLPCSPVDRGGVLPGDCVATVSFVKAVAE